MDEESSILLVIPARAGSKRIPHKNLVPIAGRSLVEWALAVACGVSCIDRIIVSTDSQEIRTIVNRGGDFAPFSRPAELARDDTPSLPVFKHALEWAEKTDARKYDYMVVLEPSAPFRLPEHVERCVKVAFETAASSVVSVVALSHHHPVRVKKLASDGRVTPFCMPEPEGLRRQDQEPAVVRNGAVYVFRRETLNESRLWGDTPYGFLMDRHCYSINIDEPLDLMTARAFHECLREKGELFLIDSSARKEVFHV